METATVSHEPKDAPSSSGRRGAAALAEAMRLPHWVKNAFVAAPILFAGQFLNLRSWGLCLLAVAAFCLLSSAVYLINDVFDRAKDSEHPTKRRRPVASGRLSPTVAIVAGAALALAGLGLAGLGEALTYQPGQPLHGLGLMAWASAYLAMNLLYSFWLKNHAIIDVIIVAAGFVLRAMAGAAAIVVPISPWLVVCTFTLCLFIALTKRRSELLALSSAEAGAARPANRGYDLLEVEHMLTVSAALAMVTYALYCLAPRTIDKTFHSANMIWTIPVVVYGMFRFYRQTRRHYRNDIFSVLVHDKIMWGVLLTYVMLSGLILKFGSSGLVRNILDF